MMFRLGRSFLLSLITVGATALGAHAAFTFEITEIWPGQPGADITKDWFEITNVGDTAWVSGVDTNLFADDSSALFCFVQQIFSLPDIQPGEAVIVLMEGVEADETTFFNAWDPVKPQNLDAIGRANGSGLGLSQPDDGVVLFDASGAVLAFATYEVSTTAQSYDVTLGAYSTVGNASGAVASFALGGSNAPAIGSPGNIPEPASIVLILMGSVLVSGRRRSHKRFDPTPSDLRSGRSCIRAAALHWWVRAGFAQKKSVGAAYGRD